MNIIPQTIQTVYDTCAIMIELFAEKSPNVLNHYYFRVNFFNETEHLRE